MSNLKGKWIEPPVKSQKEVDKKNWKKERKARHALQKGVCSICRSSVALKKQAMLDHCHATGKLRGILCRDCNMGLGNFKDDPILLNRAIHYLMLHS